MDGKYLGSVPHAGVEVRPVTGRELLTRLSNHYLSRPPTALTGPSGTRNARDPSGGFCPLVRRRPHPRRAGERRRVATGAGEGDPAGPCSGGLDLRSARLPPGVREVLEDHPYVLAAEVTRRKDPELGRALVAAVVLDARVGPRPGSGRGGSGADEDVRTSSVDWRGPGGSPPRPHLTGSGRLARSRGRRCWQPRGRWRHEAPRHRVVAGAFVPGGAVARQAAWRAAREAACGV
uniref:Uncharacterized protein n=1 Tax=Janibacter limosus TaxID=53458 RepID=A0AC61U1B7_9MICO|nr:hypothetical protein [Janibacter limosus]